MKLSLRRLQISWPKRESHLTPIPPNIINLDIFRLQLDCKFSGVIYTHNITWTRIGRSSAREMNLFREICGEHASKNVTVATTFWDFLETAQTGETREVELKKHFTIFSGVKFERCGMTQSGEPLVGPRLSTPCSIIDRLIGLQPTDLALREDLANLRKLSETRPGLALSAEVEEMRTEFAVRINAMEERIASVQPAQIDLLRNEIEKLREQVEQLQNQQRRLKNIPIFDWRNVKQEMRGFFKRFFA